MAMDAKAADTADTTKVDSTVADSVGAKTTNEAAESATANSAGGARHRHAYQLLSAAGGRTRGRRAWADASRRPVDYAGANLPAKSRRTVVLVTLVARGPRCAGARSAHVAAVVDVPMPVGGHAGCQYARAVLSEVVGRRRG